jgi:quercetin dioxygenase-like cupin family protein
MEAFIVAPGEGQVVEAAGCRLVISVPSERTGGAFAVVDLTAPPGFVAPPIVHRHTDMDQLARVLEGEVNLEINGKKVVAAAGAVVAMPRGTSFRWSNARSDIPCRWTFTYTPGGFEKYFVELAAALNALGRPPTPADMGAIATPLWKKYGLDVLSA